MHIEETKSTLKGVTILLADDDDDDRSLICDAFTDIGVHNAIRTFKDGNELTEFLDQKQVTVGGVNTYIILLDLNMPMKNGREVLKELKADPHLRNIPVIILSTSKADSDVKNSYDLGANSFLTKPAGYQKLLSTLRIFSDYWLSTAVIG
jgi:two-component system, response regulator